MILMFILIALPQDVLVGMVAGILVMWLTVKLMQWIKIHPEKDLLVTFIFADVLRVIHLSLDIYEF